MSAEQRSEGEVELAAAQYFANAFARSATSLTERKLEADKLVAESEVKYRVGLQELFPLKWVLARLMRLVCRRSY